MVCATRSIHARGGGSDCSDEEVTVCTLGTFVLNAVRVAEVALGETVVVVGAGLLGQRACASRCAGPCAGRLHHASGGTQPGHGRGAYPVGMSITRVDHEKLRAFWPCPV